MYENPKNAFVARFIGENNRLDGRLETNDDGRCTIRMAASDTRIDGTLVEPVKNGDAVTVSLRPERVQIRRRGAYNRRASRMPPGGVAAGDHLPGRPRPGARRADRQRRVHGEAPDLRGAGLAAHRRGGRRILGARALPRVCAGKLAALAQVLTEEADMQSRKIWLVAVDRGGVRAVRSGAGARLVRRILGRCVPGRAARRLFQAVHGASRRSR